MADARHGRGESTASLASVCFVAPKAYTALSGRDDVAHVGGAERQQVLLAEELARRGHRVSFIVLDHGQPDGEEIRPGIQAFTCYRLDRGLRGVRFFHPRLSGLWCAMTRANADVYYQRGAEAETGFVGHWCRRHARAFVFAVAHDTNCVARSPLMTRRSERLLFRYGLRRANAVIAQTSRQQAVLMADLGVASAMIPNCIADGWDAAVTSASDQRAWEAPPILWVGRLSEEKRPDWMISLARDLPACRFEIVGQCNSDSAFGQRMAREMASLPNVRWLGYVPHRGMQELYRNARVLVCTSESEGFPNVFLEAWSCGKGVLSTVDPDGVIARFGMGAVVTKYEEMKGRLTTLREEHEFWDMAGARGRDYLQGHHGVRAAVDALGEVIVAAVARSRGNGRARRR
jgi:glycosyltransferase involved in cell wall biosynthesis